MKDIIYYYETVPVNYLKNTKAVDVKSHVILYSEYSDGQLKHEVGNINFHATNTNTELDTKAILTLNNNDRLIYNYIWNPFKNENINIKYKSDKLKTIRSIQKINLDNTFRKLTLTF